MNDFLEFFIPSIIFLIVLFCSIGGFFVGADYLDCRGFEKGTGIETRWEWGCYAKVDGKWIPKSYVFGQANEVRIK